MSNRNPLNYKEEKTAIPFLVNTQSHQSFFLINLDLGFFFIPHLYLTLIPMYA